MNMIVSGSWDNTVCFWDGRSQNASLRLQMPGKIYGMSMKFPLLVAIMSDKRYAVWNLLRLQQGQT